jgi:hypothetical protein
MMGSMLRRGALGDGSTLSLDFTTMSTAADLTAVGITFTRASGSGISGTGPSYIGSNGYVQYAGTNIPRFDYDPTNQSARGLLVEGSSTNLLCHSTTFSLTQTSTEQYWADSALMSRSPITGPDNVAGSAVSFAGIGSAQTVIATAAVGSSAARTLSFWAKRGTGGSVEYSVDGGSTWTSLSITASWARYVVTLASANHRIGFRVALGEATQLFGPQLEAGAGASSWIPTGASTATRAQDLAAITGANFSSWWTSNNPASFLIDLASTSRPIADRIFRIADSSGSAYGYGAYFNSTTMPMQVRAVMSSASSSDVSIGANLAANTRTKIGFTVETASLKRFRDGVTASTLATPTLPPNLMTQMFIGGNPAFGNASADFHLKQFKYWPTTLSDSEMQGYTT